MVARDAPEPRGFDRDRAVWRALPHGSELLCGGLVLVSSTQKTLIEHWNGSAWSIMTSPNATDLPASALRGVTCSGAASCFAVGSSGQGAGISGSGNTLVERWNGATWAIVASPNPVPKRGSALNAVACPAATHCFATGGIYLEGQALVEEWSGSSWVLDAPPAESSQSQLTGVTCPLTTSCFAVGMNSANTGLRSLIEHERLELVDHAEPESNR